MTAKSKKILALGVVVLVVFASICYFLFFYRMVRVPTASMANTIIPGDHLLVNRHVFGEIEISRGELILFSYPKNPSEKRIARVVGLPGEKIELRGNSVYINGRELPEQRVMVQSNSELAEALRPVHTEGSGPYRVYYSEREGGPPEKADGIFATDGPFAIPANEYYVMGDNRDNAEDSRYWGTLPRALVFGKPTMIYWSASVEDGGVENVRWDRVFKRLE